MVQAHDGMHGMVLIVLDCFESVLKSEARFDEVLNCVTTPFRPFERLCFREVASPGVELAVVRECLPLDANA